MSTRAKASAKRAPKKAWWATAGNRNKIWLAVLAVGGAAAVFLFWSLASGSKGAMNEGSVPIGKNVNAVQLEDSRTGEMFDLGQYIGKKDVVVVAYMGEFCPGCSELVGELERRAADFEAADAAVVGLGYEIGQTGQNTATKHSVQSYPLLQEGKPNTFTRSIGMWSDMMGMPFMGYVVIDKSGNIVAGDQTSLSESPGAARRNVDKLLAALGGARDRAPSS